MGLLTINSGFLSHSAPLLPLGSDQLGGDLGGVDTCLNAPFYI